MRGRPGPRRAATVPLPSGVTPLDITSQVQTPTAADLIPVTENGKTWDCAYVSVIPTEDVLCKVYALADTELYAEPDMGGMFLCSTSSAESAENINSYAGLNGTEYQFGCWYKLVSGQTYVFCARLPQSGLVANSVSLGAKMTPAADWSLGESIMIPAVTEDAVEIRMPSIHVGTDTIPAEQTSVQLVSAEGSQGMPSVTVEQVTETQTLPDGTTADVATDRWRITGLKGQTSGTLTIKYTVTFLGETREGVYTVTIDENVQPGPGPGSLPESDGSVKIPNGVTPVDIQADTPKDIKASLQQMDPNAEMKLVYLRFTPSTTDIYTLGVIAPVAKMDPMFHTIDVCEIAGVRQSSFFCDAHSDYRFCRSFRLEAGKTYIFYTAVLADAADQADSVTATMSKGWKVYEENWNGGMGGGSVMLESGDFRFPADPGSIQVISYDEKLITATIQPQSNELRIVSLGEGITDVVLNVTFMDETKEGKWDRDCGAAAGREIPIR